MNEPTDRQTDSEDAGETLAEVVELDTAPPLETVGVEEGKTLYQFAYALTPDELEAIESSGVSLRETLSRAVKRRLRLVELVAAGLKVPEDLGPPTAEDHANDEAIQARRGRVAVHVSYLVNRAVNDALDEMRTEDGESFVGDQVGAFVGTASEVAKLDTLLRANGLSQNYRVTLEKAGKRIGYDLSRPGYDWAKLRAEQKEQAAKQSRGRKTKRKAKR